MEKEVNMLFLSAKRQNRATDNYAQDGRPEFFPKVLRQVSRFGYKVSEVS